jgi:hypothetical protein
MVAAAAELFQEKAKVVKVSKPTTRVQYFWIASSYGFFRQPRRMFGTTRSPRSIQPSTGSDDSPVPSKNSQIALPLRVVDYPWMLIKT